MADNNPTHKPAPPSLDRAELPAKTRTEEKQEAASPPTLDSVSLSSSYKVERKPEPQPNTSERIQAMTKGVPKGHRGDIPTQKAKTAVKKIRNKGSNSVLDHIITALARLMKLIELVIGRRFLPNTLPKAGSSKPATRGPTEHMNEDRIAAAKRKKKEANQTIKRE